MVEDTEHNSERTFAELFDDLIPVTQVLVVPDHVLLLVRVKTVIVFLGDLTVACTSWEAVIASILYSLVYIEEVDYVVFQDLALLALPKVRCEYANCIIPRHRELHLVGTLASAIPLLVGSQL